MKLRKQPQFKSTQKILYWIGERDQKLLEFHKQAVKRRKKIVHAFLRFKGVVELRSAAPPIGKIKAYLWLEEPMTDNGVDELMVLTEFTPRKDVDFCQADALIQNLFDDSGLGEYMHNTGSGCALVGKTVRDMTFREKPWKLKT